MLHLLAELGRQDGCVAAGLDRGGLGSGAGHEVGQGAVLARREREHLVADLDLHHAIGHHRLRHRARRGMLDGRDVDAALHAQQHAVVGQRAQPVVDDGELQTRELGERLPSHDLLLVVQVLHGFEHQGGCGFAGIGHRLFSSLNCIGTAQMSDRTSL
ncbi:hypothetical protein ABL840_26795 [Variovorax sp. NFACC27]|uniref:hypothetical protein n=1 Tax=unclassified Variovorax TaxID=663243 RepID=UPI0015A2852D